MSELIKITEDVAGNKIVSARELYQKLGYDLSQWSRWYKKNIVNNNFAIENEDWVGFDIKSNGNDTKDFALRLDFAKRLSMMAKLREFGVLLQSNTPKQNLISNGYFKVVETLIETNSKFKKIVSTTYATQKGIGYIHKLLNK